MLPKDLTTHDLLYVQVPDAAAQAEATLVLTGAGADPANLRFVSTPVDSFYTRDAGSPQVFRFGEQLLVDHQVYNDSFGDAEGTILHCPGTVLEVWLRAETVDGQVASRPPSRPPAEPTGAYTVLVP